MNGGKRGATRLDYLAITVGALGLIWFPPTRNLAIRMLTLVDDALSTPFDEEGSAGLSLLAFVAALGLVAVGASVALGSLVDVSGAIR